MNTVFVTLKWKSNIIVPIFSILFNVLACLSFSTWIYLIYEKSKNERTPMWFVDTWVLIVFIIEILCLFLFNSNIMFLIIGVYGITEVVVTTLRDIILGPQSSDKSTSNITMEIRIPLRWFLLSLINMFQVIFSFALLICYFGNNYCPNITDSLTSLYLSIQTFTTLGYGDFKPINELSKLLVVFELVTVLLIVFIKLPIALSMFKIERKKIE